MKYVVRGEQLIRLAGPPYGCAHYFDTQEAAWDDAIADERRRIRNLADEIENAERRLERLQQFRDGCAR